MANRYQIGNLAPSDKDGIEYVSAFFIYEAPFNKDMTEDEMLVVFKCKHANRALMNKLARKMCDYMNHLDRVLHGVIDETAL